MSEHFISRIDAENDLLAAAAFIAESIPSGEAHASAIAAVVPRYLEKGNVDLAAELANSVGDPFTRDRLLISVAAKCAQLDDDEYALQLVEAIEDPGFQAQGFEQIGFAKADKGQFEKAGDIAVRMMHPDAVYARIAIGQAAAGDDKAARKTIEEIEFPRDAVTALNGMAAQKNDSGDDAASIELLSLAQTEADEIEHDEERIRTYCEIGNLFVDVGDKTRAFQIFEKARGDAEELGSIHRDAHLAHVAIGFLNSGSIDAADRTLDVVSDKTQIASVVLAFARDHWQKEEKEEAFEALEEADAILRSQGEGETRDSRSKFLLMATVAAQFAGFQKCERGLETADLIPDETQKTSALSQIAQIATTQGSYPIADQAVSEIEGELDRAVTPIFMSRAAANAGDADKADKLLRNAADSISKLSEPTMRFTAFSELSRAYVAKGDQSRAASAFDDAMTTLLEIRNSNFRVSGLAELSKMQEEFGVELSEQQAEILRRFLQG
jgi:tetratricopeptide (TPR) repeat protein